MEAVARQDQARVGRPDVPRRVTLPLGTRVGVAVGRAVVFPFLVVAAGLTADVPARLFVLWAGRPITATVDGVTARRSPHGTTAVVAFHYVLAGRTWADEHDGPVVDAAPLHAGDRMAGRAVVAFGHADAIVAIGSPARQTVLLAVVAGLFDLFGVLAFRGTYVLPWRTRRLLRTGTAVTGELTGTQPLPGRRGRGGRVRYRFPTPAGPVYATQWVTGKACRAAYDGRPVTVVYDPARPARSVAVELSGYRVGSAPGPTPVRAGV